MAQIEDKIDKILELQVKQSIDIALIKQTQEIHLSDYEKVKTSHYKVKEQVESIKSKVFYVAAAAGAFLTLIGNAIWNFITGNW